MNSRTYHDDYPHSNNRQDNEFLELQDSGADRRRDPRGDGNDLNRKISNLERQCASMAREIERKDKSKIAAVDRILTRSNTPLTRRVID